MPSNLTFRRGNACQMRMSPRKHPTGNTNMICNSALSLFSTLVFFAAFGLVNFDFCCAGEIDRSVLPISPPDSPPITEMDARNATKPEPFNVEAPEGAPNVVIVLIDDIGFGATAPFGGAIETPTFSRLAENGLRFNRFHTTALCSPTRASLLSGRNHHNVNVGSVMEVATGFP